MAKSPKDDMVEKLFEAIHADNDGIIPKIVYSAQSSGMRQSDIFDGLQALDANGDAPVHVAARTASRAVLMALAREGVDVLRRNLRGQTALHIAAEEGRVDITKALLNIGANILQEDAQGRTALDIAKQREFAEEAKLLVEFGGERPAASLSKTATATAPRPKT